MKNLAIIDIRAREYETTAHKSEKTSASLQQSPPRIRDPRAMPMTGVRCSCCASDGIETWVIPGRSCAYCGDPCDGSSTLATKSVETSDIERWTRCGELVFLRPTVAGEGESAISGHAARLLDEVWSNVNEDRIGCEDITALRAESRISRLISMPAKTLKLHVWVGSNEKECWKHRDLLTLSGAWDLPLEWMEKSTKGQSLHLSYCRIKHRHGRAHFQILIRDIQDSIVSTIVVSSDLGEQTVRGLWLTRIPNRSPPSKEILTKKVILALRERFQLAGLYQKHPMLLPLLFLERKIQKLEESCSEGLPAVTYLTLSQLADEINRPHQATFEQTRAHIANTTEGIYNAHLELSMRKRRLTDVKTMMRAIAEGATLLEAEESWKVANRETFECVKDRIEFLKERLRALESLIEIAVTEFQSLDTMLYHSINQKDSRLNYSIARDSKKIAAATRKDSSAMKTIAILTIIFLPGTFIAALFSTGLFTFTEPSSDSIVSPEFWVYWAVALPVTILVLLIWALWSWHVRKTGDEDIDIEDTSGRAIPIPAESDAPAGNLKECAC